MTDHWGELSRILFIWRCPRDWSVFASKFTLILFEPFYYIKSSNKNSLFCIFCNIFEIDKMIIFHFVLIRNIDFIFLKFILRQSSLTQNEYQKRNHFQQNNFINFNFENIFIDFVRLRLIFWQSDTFKWKTFEIWVFLFWKLKNEINFDKN